MNNYDILEIGEECHVILKRKCTSDNLVYLVPFEEYPFFFNLLNLNKWFKTKPVQKVQKLEPRRIFRANSGSRQSESGSSRVFERKKFSNKFENSKISKIRTF